MMFGAALEPATGGAFACEVADAGSEPALTLINISLSFGGVQALSNLDLSVRQGDIHAIIGPNGAGKSSLINVISGIYRPDRGVVRIGDQIFTKTPTARLSRLGVIDNIIVGRAGAACAGFIEQIIGLGRAKTEETDARARAHETAALLGL